MGAGVFSGVYFFRCEGLIVIGVFEDALAWCSLLRCRGKNRLRGWVGPGLAGGLRAVV